MTHFENPTKVAAREKGFRWFLDQCAQPRQYWTLCNFQSTDKRAEINQAVALGVIPNKAAFHGVDRNADAIAHNVEYHPEAQWFNGDWLRVLTTAYRRNAFLPSLVYLDTFSLVDGDIAPSLVGWTMRLCPPGACLIANVMLTNPHAHRRLDAGRFLDAVAEEAGPEISHWCADVERFDYRASVTTMGTYCFRKQVPNA